MTREIGVEKQIATFPHQQFEISPVLRDLNIQFSMFALDMVKYAPCVQRCQSCGAFTLFEGDELRVEASARKRHDGNRSAAGRELGLSLRMMCYELGKAGITK